MCCVYLSQSQFLTIVFTGGFSSGFLMPQEVTIKQLSNIIGNKILFFIMITKLVKNMFSIYYGQQIL